MSRKTRPLQMVDANFVTLPHERSDDAIRMLNDPDGNPLYVAYGRPAATDGLPEWQIRQVVYTNGFPTSVLFPIDTTDVQPSNEYKFIWDTGITFTITNVTQANPGVVTLSSVTGLTAGDFIYITDVVGMDELNYNVYEVGTINVGAKTFPLLDTAGANVNTTGYGAYSSAGTVHLPEAINYTYG